MKTFLFIISVVLVYPRLCAKDSIVYLKVHFLYGSTPKRAFRDSEPRWFGGKLGGHVGIEIDSVHILNFIPNGSFHYFAHRNSRHSAFALHDPESFWSIFGSPGDSVEKLTIYIPATISQKRLLDSLSNAYTNNSPFDYAFIGMRCGAAAYYVLSHLGIVNTLGLGRTKFSIFYPRKLRKKLIRLAVKNGWKMEHKEGSTRRKWERD